MHITNKIVKALCLCLASFFIFTGQTSLEAQMKELDRLQAQLEALQTGVKQEKPDKTIIDELVKRVIGYVNFDGKPINFHDLIYIDVLTIGGNYFPFFHTDIQWNSFQKNHATATECGDATHSPLPTL